MEFKEYLRQKHVLKDGERKLQEISVDQYFNRLENMLRDGIYNDEKQMDMVLERKIQGCYRDWKTYKRTIEYYLASKKY